MPGTTANATPASATAAAPVRTANFRRRRAPARRRTVASGGCAISSNRSSRWPAWRSPSCRASPATVRRRWPRPASRRPARFTATTASRSTASTPIPLQLDGTLAEVESVDQTTGYVLTECAKGAGGSPSRPMAARPSGGAPCRSAPAASSTWSASPTAGGAGRRRRYERRTPSWATAWEPLLAGGTAPVATVGDGQILRYDGPSTLAVWSAKQGRVGTLARSPSLETVVWVAPAPSGDGAWWSAAPWGPASPRWP